MKKTLCFLLAMMLLASIFAGYLTTPAAAADGGEGSVHIISPADNAVVDGTDEITITWEAPRDTHHCWIAIKDEVSGGKPVDQEVRGNSFTVAANSVFVADGRTYKIYVAAMDAQGRVLNGSSEWEAIYVIASSSLVYASPAMINPEVSINYLAERNCYYGYGGEIPCDEDLKLKFENIQAPRYVINVAILEGSPDYGGSNEAKVASLEVNKYQSSRRYTIDREDLQQHAGQYLKVAIQPIDPDTGNYGLLSHFYFLIGNPASPEPEPAPDPEPNDTIFVSGVNTGYRDGDYFTQNGGKCSCHNTGVCLDNTSECNCIRYIEYKSKTVDLMAVQCFGWSRYLQILAFGEHDGESDHFQKIYTNRTATASGLKDALLGSVPGTHIRTSSSKKGYAHSVSILSATSSGVTITDCNHTDECQISVRSYTYEELAEFFNKYGGVDYISVYSKGSKDQPVYGGELDLNLSGSVSGKPGDVIELNLVLNTPCAFLQAEIRSELPYTIEGEGSMSFTDNDGKCIWYSPVAKDTDGKIATIRIAIPEDAKVGACFTIEVLATSAYTADEQGLRIIANPSVTVAVENPVLLGDVNGNGGIEPTDLIRLAKYLLGMDVKINERASDLDGSGHVGPIDLIRLIALITG